MGSKQIEKRDDMSREVIEDMQQAAELQGHIYSGAFVLFGH